MMLRFVAVPLFASAWLHILSTLLIIILVVLMKDAGAYGIKKTVRKNLSKGKVKVKILMLKLLG